jgi:hypothetical protein
LPEKRLCGDPQDVAERDLGGRALEWVTDPVPRMAGQVSGVHWAGSPAEAKAVRVGAMPDPPY